MKKFPQHAAESNVMPSFFSEKYEKKKKKKKNQNFPAANVIKALRT